MRVYLLIIFGMLLISSISAGMGYNNPNLPNLKAPVSTGIIINNGTLNVNNSQFWQGYTPQTYNTTFVSVIYDWIVTNYLKFFYNQTEPAMSWAASQGWNSTYNDSYVPYQGANKDVNLGQNDLELNGTIYFSEGGNNNVKSLWGINNSGGDGFFAEYWYDFENLFDDWLVFKKIDGNDAEPDGGIAFAMRNASGVNKTILKLDQAIGANFTDVNIYTQANVSGECFLFTDGTYQCTSYNESTYNSTYNLWAYNQTTAAITDLNTSYNKWWRNQTGDANGSMYNAYGTFWHNWTAEVNATIYAVYGRWFYNQTYTGGTYNASYARWTYTSGAPITSSPEELFMDFTGTTIDGNWTNAVNAAQNENLTLTGGGSWGSARIAGTKAVYRANNIILTFDVKPVTGHMMLGFGDDTTGTSYTDMPHAFYFISGGTFTVYENNGPGGGTCNAPVGTWTSGNLYRVRIKPNAGGGAEYWYSNITSFGNPTETDSVLVCNSSSASTTPLYIRFIIHSGTQVFDNVNLTNGTITTTYGTPGLTTSDNVGIGSTNTSYPLVVNANVSTISIWASGNISAAGYITRTSVYDGVNSALDSIKNKSFYLNKDGTINHSAFGYSYAPIKSSTIIGYTIEEKQIYDCWNELDDVTPIKVCGNRTERTQIPINITSVEEGVSLDKEIALIKQAVYEIKTKIEDLLIENDRIKECIKSSKDYETYQGCALK